MIDRAFLDSSEADGECRRRQQRVLLTLWLTYGSFYFCRANISPAVPDILSQFHLTKVEMGYILGGSKLAYALGQFINGQLANRFDARRILGLGMAISIAMNVLFGFATGFYFMLFVWFVNGYGQSMGWPPAVKVMAHWFPILQRGRAMGILGTCYQVTSALTLWGVGFLLAQTGNWRSAFWVPAGLFAVVMVYMFWNLAPDPQSVSLPPLGAQSGGKSEQPVRLREGLRAALLDRRIWLFGIVLGSIDVVRYGFLDWAPTLLKEMQGIGIDSAALKTAVVPLGGAIGALVSGWASDRFFAGRRAPVVCAMLVMLAALTGMTGWVVHSGSLPATVALFALVGFMIYGPQVIVVGTLPQDFASPSVVAGASGFINAMGYLGAWVGDVVTGKLAHAHGWGAALAFWNLTAIGGALLMATLWRMQPAEAPAQRQQARR